MIVKHTIYFFCNVVETGTGPTYNIHSIRNNHDVELSKSEEFYLSNDKYTLSEDSQYPRHGFSTLYINDLSVFNRVVSKTDKYLCDTINRKKNLDFLLNVKL